MLATQKGNLGKWLKLSNPLFHHLQNGDDNAQSMGLWWEGTENQMTAGYSSYSLHSRDISSFCISLAVFKSSLFPHLIRLLSPNHLLVLWLWGDFINGSQSGTQTQVSQRDINWPFLYPNFIWILSIGIFKDLFLLSIYNFCISYWLAFIIHFLLLINSGGTYINELNIIQKNSNVLMWPQFVRGSVLLKSMTRKNWVKTKTRGIFSSGLSTGGFVLLTLE